MGMAKVRLGVNIDHIATLRQVRGNTTAYPDLLEAVKQIKKAGGQQITIHLREDRRHIQDADVVLLCKKNVLPINLEMAATDEMLNIALKNKPEWVCFVPEKREELTTEGGLDIIKLEEKLTTMITKLKAAKIKTSLFIEASTEQVDASARVGAEAVEFHTGHWVLYKGEERKKEWQALVKAAKHANKVNLKVHAGHGLDYKTTKKICKLPFLREVNIGHSIVCYSVFDGLKKTIKEFKKIIKES